MTNTKDHSVPTPDVDVFPERNIQLEWEQTTPIGAGLVNLGNTCFLNSVLQSLTYTAPLANFFLGDGHAATCKQTGFCVLCALQKQVIRSLKNSGTAICPQEIVENLELIADTMRWGSQEDAHEFLVYLLDALKRSASYDFDWLDEFSAETTLIGRIFGGFVNSQVKCLKCNGSSCRFESFHQISLDIKGVQTLVKAFEKYVTPEKLSGENAYMCERCNTKVTALKGCTIEKTPNVLIVSLQRFDFFTATKIRHHVEFGEELDVRPYLTCTKGDKVVYSLYAVIVHSGSSSNCGHYFAYVKSPSGQWHHMNDSVVKAVKVTEVLSSSAYLMFYQKRGLQKTEKDKTPNSAVTNLEEQVVQLQKALNENQKERQHQDKARAVELNELKKEFLEKINSMDRIIREKDQEIERVADQSKILVEQCKKLLKEVKRDIKKEERSNKDLKQQMEKMQSEFKESLEATERQEKKAIAELQEKVLKLQEENKRIRSDMKSKESKSKQEEKEVKEENTEQLNVDSEKKTAVEKTALKVFKSAITNLLKRVTGRKSTKITPSPEYSTMMSALVRTKQNRYHATMTPSAYDLSC